MENADAGGLRSAFTRPVAILAVVAQLAACATRPANIHPRYISPLVFAQATCPQLLAEQSTITARMDPLAHRLNRNATTDSVWVGTYVVAFVLLPFTFFLLKGNGPDFEEYSALLGQREAVEQQIHAKQCS